MEFGRDPFWSAVLKVRWAERKVEEVRRLAESYFASRPVSLSPRVGSKMVEVVANVSEPLPGDLPLLVGDWAHNLRSALDHIVHAHVDDPAEQSACAFPSWRNEAPPTSEQWAKKVLRSVPGGRAEPLRRAIEQIQPYWGGSDEWLWALTELDNIDKHRVPLSVAAAVETTRSVSQGQFVDEPGPSGFPYDDGLLFEIAADPPFSHPFIKNPTVADMFTDARLEIVYSVPGTEYVSDGCTLYTFRRHEWRDIVEIEPNLSLVFDGPPREGVSVLGEMRSMTDRVHRLVEGLRSAQR
jgi:hypothetical protein